MSRRELLASTLARLESEGVLSAEQRARTEERLGDALFPPVDAAGRLVSIVAWLGAILVAAGILSFVALNWDQIGKEAKLALVGSAFVGLHVAGFRLLDRAPRLGQAVTAIAILSFGGAIALVAQIYHVESSEPHAFLLWWALSVPFVFLTRSRRILELVLALFCLWVFLQDQSWREHRQLARWREDWRVAPVLGLATAALLAALDRLAERSVFDDLRSSFRSFVAPLALVSLWGASFKWSAWTGSDSDHPFEIYLPSGIVAAAALAAAVGAYARTRAPAAARDSLLLVVAAVLTAALAVQPDPLVRQLASNLLLLAAIVALVARGTREGRPAEVNLAVAAFLLAVLSRYGEFMWDRESAALGFTGAGILLLGLGFFLERQRRRWVAAAKDRAS